MEFISTGQFIHDVLPGLMRGRNSFSALMSTYQDFEMPEPQEFPAGLNVRALMGCPMTVEDAVRGLRRLAEDPTGENAWYEDERRQGLKAIASASLPPEGFDLGVVYLGLTQFKSAVPYALRLAREGVSRTVAVLTCDCDAEIKARDLGPLMDRSAFRCAILTPWCGGSTDMREVVEGFIEVWPQVRSER